MDNEAPQSTVLGDTILEWLSGQALHDTEPGALYGELCQRLRGVGLPILRGQVAFRILHPLYDASIVSWDAGRGAVVELYKPDNGAERERFMRSPYGHVLAQRLPILRRRLTGETALLDFETLEEMRALGGTDYVLFVVGFDPAAQNGILCSWLGDRPTGFTDGEIAELQRVTRELAIALKSKIERSVAQNVAHAYLGKRAGQAVLNGLIRRGDGEKITAALWYSDLRQSTALADRLSAEAFLNLLGRYFEMTASAVLDHGGEVVSLRGRRGARPVPCRRHAAGGVRPRARRRPRSAPAPRRVARSSADGPLDFGISLHLGQVIYGNVGVPERLQFTLVGSAVNEVVRVQDLTKQLGHPLLATAPFARAVAGAWHPLGEHALRGFETPMPILTMMK